MSSTRAFPILDGNPLLAEAELLLAPLASMELAPKSEWDRLFELQGEAREARWPLNRRYSFAIPTDEALDAIQEFAPSGIVEIGCGTGFWARLLHDQGLAVAAYDAHPPCGHDNGPVPEHYFNHEKPCTTCGKPPNPYHWFCAPWFPIQVGGPLRAGEHPDKTLLLCWPPYNTPMAFEALTAYEKAGGSTLVFIGESEGGCTGDEAFHDRLEAAWENTASIWLPQWPGLHDAMYLYRKIEETR